MPIINGKKRYLSEGGSIDPAKEGPRRAPWILAEENTSAVPRPAQEKKRYHRAQVEEEKAGRVIKRYRDGGSSASAAVKQDIGDFVGNYEFTVEFGLGKVSFSKISNLGGRIEVGTFVEGGNNDYPMIYKTARRQPDVLLLQKGVADSKVTNLLLSQLKEGKKVSGILIFVKRNGSTVKTFSIIEGIIVSRKYSNLDANSGNIFIQQLEIAHTGITEV